MRETADNMRRLLKLARTQEKLKRSHWNKTAEMRVFKNYDGNWCCILSGPKSGLDMECTHRLLASDLPELFSEAIRYCDHRAIRISKLQL